MAGQQFAGGVRARMSAGDSVRGGLHSGSEGGACGDWEAGAFCG